MPDLLEVTEALTRKALDETYHDFLDEKITLFQNLVVGRPQMAVGESLAIRSMIDDHQGISSRSGYDTYPFSAKNVWGLGSLHWTEYKNGLSVDGHLYKRQTGQNLEDALRGTGNGAFSSGTVRTLISMNRDELMAMPRACQRQISKQLYGDGTGNDNNDIVGFRRIMDWTQDYATISPTGYGYHDWQMALQNPSSPNQDGYPAKWSPIGKDIGGAPLSVYGDLQRMLITLMKGGSDFAMDLKGNSPQEFEVYLSQPHYAEISEVLRGVLRRPTTESGGMNSDVGAIRDRLRWDEYKTTFYPDGDCPDGEMFIFNTNCLHYYQMDSDKMYMRKWRLSPTQDIIVIPFQKMHQLLCNDRSQTGRFTNFRTIVA